MKRAWKKYDTTYKKKADVHRDTFLPRRSPKAGVQCRGCGAFYHRRRWTFSIPSANSAGPSAQPIYCPARHKIRQHSVSGILRLVGIDRREMSGALRLLRREETLAQEKNPLGRIMLVKELKDGWQLETTTEKLAQRLGRALGKACGGSVDYKWSHNNKFVRVTWKKQPGAFNELPRQ